MYKKMISATALVVALALSATAQAQELKIGVVNVQGLLQAAPQTKATLEALQEEFAPRERTVRAKEEELKLINEANKFFEFYKSMFNSEDIHTFSSFFSSGNITTKKKYFHY